MTDAKRDIANVVGSQTLFVMLGYCFTFVVGFPLQIFLARSLGPVDLGYFGLLEAIAGMATGIMGFGVAATAVKFIPEHMARREFADVKSLIRSGTVILGISGVAGAMGVFYWRQDIARLVEGAVAPDLPFFVGIAACLIPLGLLLYFFQQALRGFLDLKYAMIGSSIIQLATKAIVAVVLIGLGYRLLGLILAVIAAHIMAIMWMAYGVWSKQRRLPADSALSAGLSSAHWRAYAGNQYGRFLSTVAVGYLDRLILGATTGTASVGVLAVVQQLQMLPQVCLELLVAVVAPVFAAAHARKDTKEEHQIFHLATDWVVRGSLPIVVFGTVFAGPLLHLYGEAFAQAGTTTLCIAMLGKMAVLMTGPSTTYLNMCGREREFLRIHIVAQVVYVVCLVSLVTWLGVTGAILAGIASSLTANITALDVARRRLGLVWWNHRFYRWIAPTLATALVAMLLRPALGPTTGPLYLAATLALLLVLFHVVHLAQGLSAEDRDMFETLVRRIGWHRP